MRGTAVPLDVDGSGGGLRALFDGDHLPRVEKDQVALLKLFSSNFKSKIHQENVKVIYWYIKILFLLYFAFYVVLTLYKIQRGSKT